MSNRKISADMLIAAWPTATDEQRANALAALTGETTPTNEAQAADRAITRKEAAKLLGVHPKTVSCYARRGLIRRLALGAGGERAFRFSLKSVTDLLGSGANA